MRISTIGRQNVSYLNKAMVIPYLRFHNTALARELIEELRSRIERERLPVILECHTNNEVWLGYDIRMEVGDE